MSPDPLRPKARLLAYHLYGMDNRPSEWRRLPPETRKRLVNRTLEAMRRAGVA